MCSVCDLELRMWAREAVKGVSWVGAGIVVIGEVWNTSHDENGSHRLRGKPGLV
jgi:hypothetical protein